MADSIISNTPFFMATVDIFDQDILVQVKTRNGIIRRPIKIEEKIVYLYLCRCANGNGQSFPSYQTIADKCCISRRKAIEVVDTLERSGLLKKIQRKKGKGNASNVYEIEHDLKQFKQAQTHVGMSGDVNGGAHGALGGACHALGGGACGAPINRSIYLNRSKQQQDVVVDDDIKEAVEEKKVSDEEVEILRQFAAERGIERGPKFWHSYLAKADSLEHAKSAVESCAEYACRVKEVRNLDGLLFNALLRFTFDGRAPVRTIRTIHSSKEDKYADLILNRLDIIGKEGAGWCDE